MILPRYFVPHATTPPVPVLSDAASVVHVVDTFLLDFHHMARSEWVVGLDALGSVHFIPASERSRLPASALAQLAHHEVATGRTPHSIAASTVYFFEVELVEHPADAEGFNDPVYLYGHLSGPWPNTSPKRVPGQLTVTRGDVLAGLTRQAPYAFEYAQTPESSAAPRGYHALLPGDRPEALEEGGGAVLAWPVVPPELQMGNASNGPMVARILHDVLTQLKEDAEANGGPAALAKLELPVPSRAMAIAELELRGYEVKGDVAVLRRQHPGVLTRMAEWLRAEKVRIPPEAGAPEFLDLARQALALLPGWPTETERVLRSQASPGNRLPPVSAPVPREVVPVPARPLPPRAPAPPARPDEWMRDFLSAHAAQKPQAAKPRLTRTRPVAPPPARSGTPAWMEDFGAASAPSAAQGLREPGESAAPAKKKPAWMTDFED
ncbi:hypothetical protein [Myxococcus fulvus]|uniref:hypothetical protein n=1 Tax=Myxococcus fulvus TaxID=33 RepID=UPI000945BC46|nr:hypothetical protein [Myxococcus fulvus]